MGQIMLSGRLMCYSTCILDYDYAIREDHPEEPFSVEHDYEEKLKLYREKTNEWEKSNRISLMYIKSAISTVIIGGIEDSDDVKTYLENIDRNFRRESSNSQNKKKKPNTPSTQASNGAHKGKAHIPAGQNSACKFLCKFCKAEGHAQRDCEGFRAWLAKKGTNVDIVSNVDELLYVEFFS
uniref:CCHC-type domain-containing protein n=1 Tax=Oryza nivara TaxID=4536 RepID=A0A0E0ICE2_ORYNI